MTIRDGMIGLATENGQWVLQNSHHCSKIGCDRGAMVAVFGKLTATEATFGRWNVCRFHVIEAAGELTEDSVWICALPCDRALHGEYCPHCASRHPATHVGKGHSLLCPIGRAFPANAIALGIPFEPHDEDECEVCVAYRENKPGPTG